MAMSDQFAAASSDIDAERSADLAWLREEIAELRRQLVRAEGELCELPRLQGQLRELVDINDRLLALNEELQEREREQDALLERYTVVVESRSWRLTRPFRRLGGIARKLSG